MKTPKTFKVGLSLLAAASIASLVILNLPSKKVDGITSDSKTLSNSTVTEAPAKSTPQPDLMRLRIPAISLDKKVVKTGITADGSIQAPSRYDAAAWYDHSPIPGDVGPSIIVGHVDSRQGTAVFWRLKQLRAGQIINIDRQDGKTASFVITEVAQYHKNNFPSQAVYGNINYAGIRLITCGGTFNTQTHQYSDNIVVYGTLR